MPLLSVATLLALLALTGCASVGENSTSAALTELAPTGTLRVGVVSAPAPSALFVVKDEKGQPHGVTVDLGSELARTLGVPVSFVVAPNSGELTRATSSGSPNARAYVTAFMENAKASGVVRRAFDDAGLTDLAVAPPAAKHP